MPDLAVKPDDPYLLHQRALATPPAGAPPTPAAPPAAAKTSPTLRDVAERWQPRAARCAPATTAAPPRSPATLLAAMKRSATSAMVPPAPPDESMKHGLITVAVHAGLEGAAKVLARLGLHAAAEGLVIAAPLVTFAEAGVHVLEQNQAGDIGSQRRAAAQGFATALAVALNRGTRCFDDVRRDPVVLERGGLSDAQHERDFYTWGASAAARFVTTLSPAERRSLMATLGTLPSGQAVSQDTNHDLARRIQGHVLGAEWVRP